MWEDRQVKVSAADQSFSARRVDSGFTLIELLVVIAIVAVLAALLLSVIGNTREKVRAAKCISNLRQLNLAIMMCADDTEQRTPPFWVNEGNWSRQWPAYTWRDVIYPYVVRAEVYYCPSAPTLTTWIPMNIVWGWGQCGYGGAKVHQGEGSPTDPWSQGLGSFTDPSQTFLLMDYDDNLEDPAGPTDSGNEHLYIRGVTRLLDQAVSRHAGRANYAFADGHVARLDLRGRICNTLGGGHDNCPWSIE